MGLHITIYHLLKPKTCAMALCVFTNQVVHLFVAKSPRNPIKAIVKMIVAAIREAI